MSQFKEGVAKVTSKISTVASNVMETFQVHILYYVCVHTQYAGYGERGGKNGPPLNVHVPVSNNTFSSIVASYPGSSQLFNVTR